MQPLRYDDFKDNKKFNKRRTKRVSSVNAKEYSISKGYFVRLTLVIVLGLIFSTTYLTLRSEIIIKQDQLVGLEDELNNIKEVNDTMYYEYKEIKNLESIRQTAIEEYGMVNANQNQIIYYNDPNNNTIIQYDNKESEKENKQ